MPLLAVTSFAPSHYPRALRGVVVWLVWQLLLSPILLPIPALAQGDAPLLTPIATLQGAGLASPFDGEKVTTWGVVTGVSRDGFYLQDPLGDGDPQTSDGLFAFTYDAPTVTVGECVQVAGEIAEYYAKTELNWVTTISPADGCGVSQVAPVPLPLLRPGDDPVATLEALEGMVVQLPRMTAVAHSPTKHFGNGEDEIAFLPAQWQRYFGDVHLFHDQPEVSGLLYLSNQLGAVLPAVQWGDLLQTGRDGLVGVLDYNFGKYQLLPFPGQTLTVMANEVAEQALPPMRGDEYALCSFNLHGLGQGSAQFPNADDYAAALRHRAQLIATWLGDCTVIALQETGRPEDADALAAALSHEHGLAYTALAIVGPASGEEGFPLTNSILVDAERVTVALVEAVTGCAGEDFGIFAPGVCAAGTYPVFDRPPLLAKLVIDGAPKAGWQNAQTVWVIDNHWKSKSGDEEANALLRAAQANAVAARVQAIVAADADAQVVVLGDLNDFYQGAAVNALQAATGLFHPYDWLPRLERYTYLFNGAAQVLDHVLVTPNLTPQLALVQILHIQADTAAGENPLAYSDHDPVVVRLRPGGAVTVGGSLAWAGISVIAQDDTGMEVAAITDAQGEFRLWGLSAGMVMLQMSAPAWIVLEDEAQLDPASPLTADVSINVTLDVNVGGNVGIVTPPLPLARHTTAITGAWVALNTPWLAGARIP